MRYIDKSYKTKKNSETNEDTTEFSEEFKNVAKEMFDAVPDLEKLPYFAAGKAYDAPYELWERDVEIDEDTIYDYEEKYGQGSFDKWFSKFLTLSPNIENWKDTCDDLYPGWTTVWAITRDLTPDEYGEE